MQRPQISIVLGSVLGAGILHFILVACSSSGGGAKGVPDAQAQGTPSTNCAAWTVAQIYTDNELNPHTTTLPTGLSGTQNVPAGWEPFGMSSYGNGQNPDGTFTYGRVVYVRKCAQ